MESGVVLEGSGDEENGLFEGRLAVFANHVFLLANGG
jgi:hypothetical protein